jgi:hypothetical protein
LAKIEAQVKALTDSPHVIKVTAVFDDASLWRARTAFATLDSMISRDALQRLRTSPYGSVLGTLDALFSPHPLAGGPTPQQAASRGLLGQMLAQQATTAVSGAQGGTGGRSGQTLGEVTLGAATGAAAGAAQRISVAQAATGGGAGQAGRDLQDAADAEKGAAADQAAAAADTRGAAADLKDAALGLNGAAATLATAGKMSGGGGGGGGAAAGATAGAAAGAATGAAQGGGGPSAAANLLNLAAAAASAGDAAKFASAAQKAFTGSETDVAAAAKLAADTLRAQAAATDVAADASRYGYAAQVAQTLATKAAAQSAGDAAQKTALFTDYISRGTPVWSGGANAVGFLKSHLQLFGGALTSVGLPAILAAASGFHLLSEAIIETLGTFIPATIAFTAFGIAAIPTVKDLYSQMSSLYTASQAYGQSVYPLTGGFQKMAAAVKPEVYVLFGEALVEAGHNTGSFTVLAKGAGAALDQLGARFVYATTQGKGVSKFATQAAADLSMWGNNLGNLGGIFGGLLKVLPGYAEIIGNVFGAVTHDIEVFVNSGLGQGILKIGLFVHGGILYIGLLGTAFAKLAQAGAAGAATLFEKMALGLGNMGLGGSAAAKGLAAVADGAKSAAGLPWGWISLAAAGFAFLVYQLVNAKDAAQQFNAAMQQAIQNAPLTSLATTISSAMQQTAAHLADTNQQLKQFSAANAAALAPTANKWGEIGKQVSATGVQFHSLNAAAAGYQQGLAALTAQQDLVRTRVAALGKAYGGTANALSLLTGAGVTSAQITSTNAQTWAEAQIEVKAYQDALAATAARTGGLGAALNALNFAAGDSANALGQVVSSMQSAIQAEDSLLNTVIGGEQAFIAYQQGIQQTAKDAKAAGASLSGLNSQSLTLAGDYYNTVIPNLQKLSDSLRSMGAPAALYQTIMATGTGQALQFAGSNLQARTVLVDLINNAIGPGTVSLQNLNHWVGRNATSLQGMAADIAEATINASQLAQVLQQNLNGMLAQAAANALGGQAALNKFALAVVNGDTSAQQLASSGGASVLRMFEQMYQDDIPAAKRAFVDWAENGLGLSQSAADALWQQLVTLQKQIDSLHGKTITVSVVTGNAAAGTASASTPGGRLITQRAAGGLITGGSGPTADDRLIAASGGEYVVRAASVSKYGTPMMDAINAGTFAAGGLVPRYADGGWLPGGWGGGGWGGMAGLLGLLSGASGGSAYPVPGSTAPAAAGTAYVGNYTGVVSPASGGFGLTATDLGIAPSNATSSASASSAATGTSAAATAATAKAKAKKAVLNVAQSAAAAILEGLLHAYVFGNEIGLAKQAVALLDKLGVTKYDHQVAEIGALDSLWLGYRKTGSKAAEKAVDVLLAGYGVHRYTPVTKVTGNAPKAAVIRNLEALLKTEIALGNLTVMDQANALLRGYGVTRYTPELQRIRNLETLLAGFRRAKDTGEIKATETLLREAGVRHFAQGGTVWEPVVGFGTRSGGVYSFAEHGPETVTPGASGGGDMVSELRALRGQMDKLIKTTAAVPAKTGEHVGAAFGGVGQQASFARRYHSPGGL